MLSKDIFTPPIQQIHHDISTNNVEIHVLRLDLMHPFVNGNKWFKLKYNLEAAKQENLNTILTFGGAFSNHIYATAAAGNLLNFHTIGVIRGEETLPLNPTLDFAAKQGMQLVYIDRQTYRQRNTQTLEQELTARFGNVFLIPEGGSNLYGVKGCTEIIDTIISDFDTICVACGTATTLTGIALSLNAKQRVIGFPVLKGGDYLKRDIDNLLAEYLSLGLPVPGDRSLSWELVCNYHFGGYAKVNKELIEFKKGFEQMHGIPLDYVYTAKMFYGVIDLIKLGYFDGCRLLLVHTGGLQGNLGREF
jgi:1-aminocyclopropane-1-carboxylate deaminase